MQVDPKHNVIVIKKNVNSCSISRKEGRSYLKHLRCWPEVFHSIFCISVCAFVSVLCRCRRSVVFLILWYKCISQNWCLALALLCQNVGILCCTGVWLVYVMFSEWNSIYTCGYVNNECRYMYVLNFCLFSYLVI